MLSMSIQPGIKGIFTYPSLPSQKATLKTSYPLKDQAFSLLHSSAIQSRQFRRIYRVSATEEAVITETPPEDSISTTTPRDSLPSQETEKLKVVVKQVEKPRLVLKFIWMEKNIGLALDQVIPGHGTIPLSPYYFWPRKDAWEELKTTLESKPWISQKKMIILLNQATDIINLWQQSGGNLSA